MITGAPARHRLRRAVAGVTAAAAAAVLAGCGSGGGAAPEGEVRPIGFGTSTRVDFFIPQGWRMVNQNDLATFAPDQVSGQNGVTYALLDSSRIPDALVSAVPDDEAARTEFADAAQAGAAVTVQFTELNPCESVQSMLSQQQDTVEFDSREEPDDGIGDHRVLGETTRQVDGTDYRYVQYYASIPLSSTHCVGLLLQSTLRAPDDAAVDAARDTITTVAEHSTTTEAALPGD